MKFSLKMLIRHTVESGEVFVEESIIMLDAASFDDAYEKAESYVEENEIASTYVNMYGKHVKTEVISMADCFSVYDDEEVVEVYSNIIKCRGEMKEETVTAVMQDSATREELLPLREFPDSSASDETDMDEE